MRDIRAREVVVTFSSDGDDFRVGLRMDFNALANIEAEPETKGDVSALLALVHAHHRAYHQRRGEPAAYGRDLLGSVMHDAVADFRDAITALHGGEEPVEDDEDPPVADSA